MVFIPRKKYFHRESSSEINHAICGLDYWDDAGTKLGCFGYDVDPVYEGSNRFKTAEGDGENGRAYRRTGENLGGGVMKLGIWSDEREG